MNKKKNNTKKQTVEKRVVKKGLVTRIILWFKGVKTEVGQVTWPSRKDLIKYSIATFVFIIFFATYFYLISILMAFIKSLI